MNKVVYVVAILLALTACALAVVLITAGDRTTRAVALETEALEESIAALQRQIQEVESERDIARGDISKLRKELAVLISERREDRQVIEDLWTMLMASARREKEEDAKKEKTVPSAGDDEETVERGERTEAKYDIDVVKDMLESSGGDLEAALRRMITAEGIDRTLQAHEGEPAYWVAAASLAADPGTALEYLQEAARLHPDSPAVLSALVGAQIAAGVIDESTFAYLNELERVDPTNALGDCYAAHCQFQSGDIDGALQSLSQAGAKGRFADDRIGMLMTRYDYLLNEGVSDSVALGLAAVTLPLEHLGLVRQTLDPVVEQVRSLSAAGQLDDALQIAQDITSVGRTVSSSGRFLVQDRVGIALEQAGLSEQRQIYEALGDVQKIQEIDLQFQAVEERSATIDIMIEGFGPVLANMTAEDLAAYVDSTILKGEFTTLQEIPEIAEALNQPTPSLEEPAVTPAP